MSKPTANQLRNYIATLRGQPSVGHAPRPTKFSYDTFWREFYAPGGLSERLDPRLNVRVYRVAAIVEMDDRTGLPQMVDHHAAKAWRSLCNFIRQGYCPDHVESDSKRALCDSIARLPESLRDWLDPVFEGLARIDQDRYYEGLYADWSGNYYTAMRTAFSMSTSAPKGEVYKTRFRLVRQAARECIPELIDWFNEFRQEVCDGGYSGNWRVGDEFLEAAGPEMEGQLSIA